MDISEVLSRPDGKGVAQTNWSGCAPLEADLAIADIDKLIGLLPNRRSSKNDLGLRLRNAAARFQRNLRQDDFGPTRADQIAMLSRTLEALGALRGLLSNLADPHVSALVSRSASNGAQPLQFVCATPLPSGRERTSEMSIKPP